VTDHLGEARRVAVQVAARLVSQGAEAVVLVGSVARGDALPTSDVDLVALGAGPERELMLHGGRQVSVSWPG
jgi:predicted nucleotidyltransferase